ncbi:MAG: hypothetical protein OXU22_09245 [Gammaproteobacteria bacterium]|nr:hypothetical protein [Gammaproteobacteria bacterium]
MELWEQLLIGALGLAVLLWIFPGIKPMLEESKKAPKDWMGLLIPIALVVAFVVFLAATM